MSDSSENPYWFEGSDPDDEYLDLGTDAFSKMMDNRTAQNIAAFGRYNSLMAARFAISWGLLPALIAEYRRNEDKEAMAVAICEAFVYQIKHGENGRCACYCHIIGAMCKSCELPANCPEKVARLEASALGAVIGAEAAKAFEELAAIRISRRAIMENPKVTAEQITWYGDSPDAGPDCLCSVCGLAITGGVPTRITDTERNVEARFHSYCFEAAREALGL